MKIVKLLTNNIKNLKAIEIDPDGAVILEGKNGAGKSAVLDSIFMALTGKKIAEPIRNGEKKAEINIDLGAYKVKKVFTPKGERLEVVSSNGSVFASPQTMLNEILGNLSFDPLAFAEMGRNAEGMRRQRAMLAELVGLDFTELNKKRVDLYNERTIKNREIKGGDPTSYKPDPMAPLPLESLVSNMPVPVAGTPREEISMVTEMAKVQELERKAADHEDFNSEIKAKREHIGANCEDMAESEKEIEGLQARIGELQNAIKEKKAENAEIQKVIDAQVEPENVTQEQITAARQALLEVDEKNKAIRKAVDYDTKLAQLEAARKVVAHLEEDMMKIDLEKDRRMKEAVFPIEGLALTDDFITYKGKPFSQLSTGEQIRVSTAMAMAMNPTLKVILIREGSLLDKKGLAEITALAKNKDYQLWIERVSEDRQVGIYLEDGAIVHEEAKV
jgi:energy-coupling factor transporter ATP-binding protein EcfA2